MDSSKKFQQNDSVSCPDFSFIYEGEYIQVFPELTPLGVILPCAEYVPCLTDKSPILKKAAFILSFYWQIHQVGTQLLSFKRHGLGSMNRNLRAVDFAEYVCDRAYDEAYLAADNAFRGKLTELRLQGHKVPDRIRHTCYDAYSHFSEYSASILRHSNCSWSAFAAECPSVGELISDKVVGAALKAAVSELARHLTLALPQLIEDFRKEYLGDVLDSKALCKAIARIASKQNLSAEQKANILRAVTEMPSFEYYKSHENIINAFYRGKIHPLRPILSLGGRVNGADRIQLAGDVCSFDKLLHNQNNEGFFRFLKDNDVTVGELLDYAVDGAHLYLGIHTPEADYQRFLARLRQHCSLEDKAIDVIHRLIAEEVAKKDAKAAREKTPEQLADYQPGLYRRHPMESDEAAIDYIQLSHSKLNYTLYHPRKNQAKAANDGIGKN